MQTAIRFLQIIRARPAPPAPGAMALTFGGVPLSFVGTALTFQPA